jgi:hypothetical protein
MPASRGIRPDHCQDRACEADLLDHDWHVQREERVITEAQKWARQARRYATCAQWSAGIGILRATIASAHGPGPYG